MSMQQLPPVTPVIAITGPTATGKTALGVALAKWLNTEIISADSRVIYRHLDIGTAKPTEAEKDGIPHAMIDVADPTEEFSVVRYQEQASGILQEMQQQGKTPIVVGGTGFYLKALLQTDFIPPVPPHQGLRDELAQLAEAQGAPVLHQMLSEKDPRRAADLHPNDQFRIIRALEIIHQTGAPVPQKEIDKNLPVCWIGLRYQDRDILRKRIDDRITVMLEAGWLDEVARLIQAYGPNAHALQITHGYPELVAVLQGRLSMEEAIEQIQVQIHQYARRQLTWFRRNLEIHWLDLDNLSPEMFLEQCQAHIARQLQM